jgi:hypothetical protein
MPSISVVLASILQAAAVRLVGLRHSVTCSAVLPLAGASWWRVAVYRDSGALTCDQPGDEGASESLLDLRAFGCSVEVFYREQSLT